jgi:hypothetical protein
MVCKKVTITESGGEVENPKGGPNKTPKLLTRRNVAIAGVALTGIGLLARE